MIEKVYSESRYSEYNNEKTHDLYIRLIAFIRELDSDECVPALAIKLTHNAFAM